MRIPRKSALTALILVAALAALAATATAGSDTQNGVTQTFEVETSKTKVIKEATKKDPATPIDLNIDVGISTADGGHPPSSNLVKLGLDRGFIFFNKGLKECPVENVEDKSIAEAEAACKKSKVGSGSSIAACNLAPPLNGEFPGEVVAFNGENKGKNKQIILHANTALPTGPVPITLVGTLNKKNVLTVPVEELGGGACSIKQFETTVGEKYKHKGETENYVSAECPDKEWNNDGEFNFNPNSYGVTQLNPTEDVACKGKRA